jgi:hypothetical protein
LITTVSALFKPINEKHMKTLTLLLPVITLAIANATYATGASASNATASGTGTGGAAVSEVTGTNGYFLYTKGGGNCGSITNVTNVDDVSHVLVVASVGYASTMNATCTVCIPSGETGVASYSVTDGATGTASLTIGTTSYSTTCSGSITLSPGTYYLSTSASTGAGGSSESATGDINITYD